MPDVICPGRRVRCPISAECGARMQCAALVCEGWVYATPPAFVQELLTRGQRTAKEALYLPDGISSRVWQRERWAEPDKAMVWHVYRYKDPEVKGA